MASDLELLEAWRAGDENAGNELFTRHFPAVYRFFCNKVDESIEDLVQQTFLACVEGKERFRGDSSFRTYLFAVARRRLYSHFSDRGTQEVPLDPDSSSVRDFSASPTRVLARRAEERLLLEALRRIPFDYQVALELYHWEGLRGPELAAVLGIPEPTVRSRIRRGTERVRRFITELAESGEVLESTLANLEQWARSLREQVGAGPRTA